MPSTFQPPSSEEYAPYQEEYVRRVHGDDLFAMLERQPGELRGALEKLSQQQALFRPAPEEWSIKEVIGHINDCERIFFYRALCISRGETQSLPGFDQDDYVRGTKFDAYSLKELLDEFDLTRQANLISLRRFSADTGRQRGLANNQTISVRAQVYIMAGHVAHHLESLHTVYLKGFQT